MIKSVNHESSQPSPTKQKQQRKTEIRKRTETKLFNMVSDLNVASMNPNLDIRCGLCEIIIPKYDYNSHLYHHHKITTARGVRHQRSMVLPVSVNDSASSEQSSVVFNLSKQGYDPHVRQLLDDKHFSEALDVLNAR